MENVIVGVEVSQINKVIFERIIMLNSLLKEYNLNKEPFYVKLYDFFLTRKGYLFFLVLALLINIVFQSFSLDKSYTASLPLIIYYSLALFVGIIAPTKAYKDSGIKDNIYYKDRVLLFGGAIFGIITFLITFYTFMNEILEVRLYFALWNSPLGFFGGIGLVKAYQSLAMFKQLGKADFSTVAFSPLENKELKKCQKLIGKYSMIFTLTACFYSLPLIFSKLFPLYINIDPSTNSMAIASLICILILLVVVPCYTYVIISISLSFWKQHQSNLILNEDLKLVDLLNSNNRNYDQINSQVSLIEKMKHFKPMNTILKTTGYSFLKNLPFSSVLWGLYHEKIKDALGVIFVV